MPPLRILVVEDERIIALHLRRLLVKLGHQVGAVASSGEEALALIQAIRPDLVMMDINIEGALDGVETASRIPESWHIPVIYLTAYAEEAIVSRACATKPFAYLLKPFTEQELRAAIGTAIERHAEEKRLKAAGELLTLAMEAAEMGAWEIETGRGALVARGKAIRSLGLGEGAAPWDGFLGKVAPEDRAGLEEAVSRLIEGAEQLHVDFRRHDNPDRWYRLQGKALASSTDRPPRLIGMVMDVTRSRRTEGELKYLAHFDSLTELPNRLLGLDRLRHAIERARREKRQLGLLFVDLDNFKLVNDSLGHDVGDRLLRIIARRMKSAVRAEDTIARLGGDEFMVILERIDHPEAAINTARKIIAAIGQPIMMEGRSLDATASIGISLFPHDATEGAALVKAADSAMYAAKSKGRHGYAFYNKRMTDEAQHYLGRDIGLRRALSENALSLFYQPLVAIGGGIRGVEAFLRWRTRDFGLLEADDIVPHAEKSGLILDIDRWVLKTAFAQAVAWEKSGLAPMTMAVNVSGMMARNGLLPGAVQDALAESGFDPALAEIEIREGVLEDKAAEGCGEQLAALGVGVAIDGFGSGRSSLLSLSRSPVRRLKLHRTLTADPGSPADRLAEAALALAKSLGLEATALGIETETQLGFLRHCGFDSYQGRLASGPIEGCKIADWIAAGNAS